jgi:large subunit ribosomal protein L24
MRVLTHRKTRGKRNRTRHEINAEREKIRVVKGDTVRVVRGDDKGKEGKIIRVHTKTGRVVIEGINIVKKHRKARRAEEQSGIIEMPAPMHASNVMLLDPKSGAPTRTRAKIDTDGTKERISVKSGDAIVRPGKS